MSRLCKVCAQVNQKFWRYPKKNGSLQPLTHGPCNRPAVFADVWRCSGPRRVSPYRVLFAFPVEDKSLAEFLDFERPGNRFSGPFPMRHDCRQKLKVADMRS